MGIKSFSSFLDFCRISYLKTPAAAITRDCNRERDETKFYNNFDNFWIA